MGRKWNNNGRPTYLHSQVHRDYKAAKRVFRREKECAEHIYEKNNDDELKETQHINHDYFWHLVRKARNKCNVNMCHPVYNDEGKLVSDKSGLSIGWVQHHSVLSTLKKLPHYDSYFKVEMERTVSNEIVWLSKLFEVTLSVQEITKARKSLKKNKASG